jgi:hypothetical protein
MNLKDLAALIPTTWTRPAATAAEQAELRRRILRGELRADTTDAQVSAALLGARAAALRDRMERGELDDAALVAAVQEAHALRCKLAAIEAGLWAVETVAGRARWT